MCARFLVLTIFTFSLLLSTAMAKGATNNADSRPFKTVTTDGAALSHKTFDVIIVGGGLSGMTLANRLSTSLPLKKILVIEAGDDTRKDTNVSTYASLIAANADPHINWQFPTVAQTQAGQPGGVNFTKSIDAGKGLGGGTSINGGIYDAPIKSQVETFFKGGWTALVEGMKKTQNFHPPSTTQVQSGGATFDPSVHATGGPVDLAFSESMYLGPHQHAFLTSLRQALPGLRKNKDHANGDNDGVAVVPQAIVPGNPNQIRVSSATAYLSPIEDKRPNLTVLTGWRAAKIDWCKTSSKRKRADGVTIQQTKEGPTHSVLLRVKTGQIIVSAGTIRSPLFLEHSGVGDAAVLSSAGIAKQVELAGVGKNLQDQALNYIFLPRDGSVDLRGTGPQNIKAMASAKYLFPNNLKAVESQVRSRLRSWAADMVRSGAVASKVGLLEQYDTQVKGIFQQGWPIAEFLFQTQIDDIPLPGIPKNKNMVLQAWYLSPFSRGKTHAKSASTWDSPELDPRYWSAEFDLEVQVAAMQASRRTFEMPDMKKLSTGDKVEILPGFKVVPNSPEGGDPKAWTPFILASYRSAVHPVGTCSMLPLSKGGVVDEEFKVYGTDNVRVVDASVLPMELTSHITATLYALTERAAVVIARSMLPVSSHL